MDGPGDELLARAALPLDEDRRVRLGDALDDPEDLAHRQGVAEDGLEPDGGLLGLSPVVGLDLESLEMAGPPEHDPELVEVDRLEVVVGRPQVDRPQRVLVIVVAGHDEDLRRGTGLEDLFQRLQAFLGRVRAGGEAEVQGDHVGLDLVDERHGPGPILGDGHRVLVPKGVLELGPDALIILDDQQLRLAHSVLLGWRG